MAVLGATARAIVPVTAPLTELGLRPDTQQWWDYVIRTWVLDQHHARILHAACAAWDTAELARETWMREGMTVPAANGGVKAHPAVAIATAARAQFATLVHALDLDDAGTPGGTRR